MAFDTSRLTNNVSAATDAEASKVMQRINVMRGPAPMGGGDVGNKLQVGPGGKAEHVQQTLVYIESDRDYYFAIEVSDDQGRTVTDMSLEPGQAYLVRAQASLNPVAGGKQTRKIETEGTLELQVPEGCAEIEPPSGALRSGNPLSQSVEFKLTVRPDCGVHVFTLELAFYEQSLQSQRAVVTSRELSINITSVTRQLASRTLGISVTEDAPARTGFCYVQPLDEDTLKVVFFLNKEKPRTFQLDRMKPADLPTDSLENHVKAFYESVESYFKSQSNLLQWLSQRIPEAGEPLSIILLDDADSRIPWELAILPSKHHLGSDVRLIRGLREHYGDASHPLAFSEQRLGGQARQLLSPESDPFQGWATSIEDPQELLDALNLEPPVSLVCIAVNSLVHAETLKSADFDALWHPAKTRFEIGFGFGDDPPQRPLFLIPSPHSGWMFGKGKHAVGLPRTLLERAGSAVIGTLVPVHPDDALAIATHLFAIAKNVEGLCPAEAIRRLRMEAEVEVAQSRKPGDLTKRKAMFRRAVTKLLLVYYGPPNLRVCLEAPPQPDPGGEDGRNSS